MIIQRKNSLIVSEFVREMSYTDSVVKISHFIYDKIKVKHFIKLNCSCWRWFLHQSMHFWHSTDLTFYRFESLAITLATTDDSFFWKMINNLRTTMFKSLMLLSWDRFYHNIFAQLNRIWHHLLVSTDEIVFEQMHLETSLNFADLFVCFRINQNFSAMISIKLLFFELKSWH
jgi:hypothetical protein